MHYDAGRVHEAVAAYTAAVSLDPRHPEVFFASEVSELIAASRLSHRTFVKETCLLRKPVCTSSQLIEHVSLVISKLIATAIGQRGRYRWVECLMAGLGSAHPSLAPSMSPPTHLSRRTHPSSLPPHPFYLPSHDNLGNSLREAGGVGGVCGGG